jgi:fibronectin-binding autotransporter adhesin
MRIARILLWLLLLPLLTMGQTSWKGTTSTSWSTASNWTAGVPTSTVDAVIGDASFTGTHQPTVNVSSTCKSLTVTSGILTQSKSLTVAGNLTIAASGRINQAGVTLTVKGNWINNGIYSGTSTSSRVTFGGTAQSIGGTVATPFRRVTVNAGSTVTLNINASITTVFTVNGTFIPAENATPFLVSGASTLSVGASGVLKINAATFAANYGLTGTVTLTAGSTVEYSATLVNQTVRETLTYSTLLISGSGTKTAAGNLNTLVSSSATAGNITVNEGILDLSTFTANRGTTVTGGTLTVANGATLKIGGTTLPANYATRSFSLTSTVEYSGGAQTVSAQTYGNLTLSSSSGAAVKTMPATDFTIAGNLTSTIAAGTSVSYTAASNITISGNVSIGAATTFNGATFTLNVAGNWVNNGTFTGSTSTVNMTGAGTGISGTGTHNFNNLSFSASNITGAATSNITVAGNLSTTGPGLFTHAVGGTFTMSGTTKTISGTGFTFDNLTISGTVSSTSNITITGNLSVSGTFSNSSNTVIMSGTTKTISGGGTITFSALSVTGTVTTTNSFSIGTFMDVSGSFTASAGTATFTGTSTLNGTANLFNVTLNGTSLQLSTNAVLGIAGVYTLTAGTLNVTSTPPNTVNYNGSGAQTVTSGTYSNLILSNGNTKTAGGAITANSNLTIAASTTFVAGTFSHTVLGNWINAGTFTAGTSTFSFTGAADATITGVTTFNILTINKTATTNQVNILSNVTTVTLNMTNGSMNTGSNTITMTGNRTGNGIILGTITHNHGFGIGTNYAFESPNMLIGFFGLNAITSVTVTVTKGQVNDFPSGASINRVYNVTLAGGSISLNTTLRLHYEDVELNGNNETTMLLWHYNGTTWASVATPFLGTLTQSPTSNYVELTGLALDVSNRWTISDLTSVVRWNGSVSSDWFTAANWTVAAGSPSRPPAATDIVEIGTVTFTNQPTIATGAAVAKSITFGSVKAATLTLNAGGSLTTQGNISGTWSANATHTINANNQNITVNGDLTLSDGTANHVIDLNMGTGTTIVAGSLTESGGANVTFTGAGALNIGNNFNYTSGTFTPSTSTVTYNGIVAQTVAGLTYNNLVVNKTAGIAAMGAASTINGNLTVTAGEFDINATTSVTGDVNISSGAMLNGDGVTTTVGGNWNNSGTFLSSGGTILFNGSGTQTISATTFNNLTINKPGSTATLTGNVVINGNVLSSAGTFNLSTFICNRSAAGGTLTAASGTILLVSGANNLPANFSTYNFSSTSTVNFNGTVAQTIPPVTLGNVIFSNGGTKTLTGPLTVNGDLTINSGATFSASTNTINLTGNWVNGGTFTPGTGTVILNGSSKTITGTTTFNRLTVYGSYAVSGSDITYNGLLNVTPGASYNGGSGLATVNGDLTNSGSLISNGTTTFTGTTVQTIRFLNAITSNSSGIINFNGNVSPVLNSTSAPVFATLNVNNTAGINPSVGWTVGVAFNISSGAIFNGGAPTHNILGSFTNNGTVTSSGTINFIPFTAQTIQLAGTSFSSTGTVIFGGSSAMSVTGTPTALNNVMVTNSNGVTPAASWNMTGDFIVANNAIFNAGSNTFTVAGDIESDGTLNGGTSLFTMSGTLALLSGSPGTTFYDLTITGTVAANSDFNVSHNFTNNNAFDASIGTLNMTGATASVIGGTATTFDLAQFAIIKNTGVTTTLAKNVTAVSDLHIFSGILDAATFSITQDVTNGGALSMEDNSSLKIGGTNSLPAFSTYALDTLSTVEYNGSTQAVSGATPYGYLTISTAGTKTASDTLYILSDFTLTNGTFVPGTFPDTINGNWNMTSGTFTSTGSTFIFNGATPQNIFSTGAFNNLTVNKTINPVTLTANLTVNGVLRFSAGKIQTGSTFSVIIPAAGSVSNASQATGWVFGRLQKNVALAPATSRSFEIGDNTSYTPATVTYAGVSVAGNFSAVTLTPDHPNIATSGFNSSKTVNRYWSFTNSGTVFTTASVTVNWVAADVDAGAITANFKVADYNGSTWSLPTTVSPLATSIQGTGLSFVGDIAVGELVGANTWTGAISTDWYLNGNWLAGFVPLITTDALIPSSLTNYPLITTGTATTKNITIQTGAAVTVNGGAMQIAGVISNTGTFTTSNGSIEFISSTAQIIPAGAFAGNLIKNLTTNNSAGVTLSGTLQISGILKATTGTFSTGGFLTLLSTATQTALIDGSGAGAVTGNVTMQRYLASGFGYKYVSSPFTSATVNEFANDLNLAASFPTFYTYIENQASSGYTVYTTTTGALTPMLGYVGNFGASSAPKTVDMTGVVNNGTITSPTLLNHNQFYTKGFNLAGNPYPSPVNWDAVGGWTKTNIDNALYYFNAGSTNQYTGTYSTYINGISSDGIANGIIPAMQGFFVHVTNGTFPVTAAFAVNNTARVNNLTPNYHRDAPATVPLLRLNASFENEADAMVVYFDHSATFTIDPEMDALKLINTDPLVPNLYSLSDTTKYSIHALPYMEDNHNARDSISIIPLGLVTQQAGFVTFKVQDMERIPYGWHIYLKDEKMGITQDLQRNPSYRQEMEKGEFNHRFSLVFSLKDLMPVEETFKAYSAGGKIYVYINGDKEAVTLSNMSGQVLLRQQVSGIGYHDLGPSFSSGVYIVSKGLLSKKVLVAN